MVIAVTNEGRARALLVDDTGALIVTGGGGGGGGGDASASNQATMIARLNTLITQTDGVEGSLTSMDGKLTTLIAAAGTPVDSIGDALPADFAFLAETYGYTGDDLTTIVKTNGANTWTQTFTYVSGKVTAISKWVKV